MDRATAQVSHVPGSLQTLLPFLLPCSSSRGQDHEQASWGHRKCPLCAYHLGQEGAGNKKTSERLQGKKSRQICSLSLQFLLFTWSSPAFPTRGGPHRHLPLPMYWTPAPPDQACPATAVRPSHLQPSPPHGGNKTFIMFHLLNKPLCWLITQPGHHELPLQVSGHCWPTRRVPGGPLGQYRAGFSLPPHLPLLFSQ